MNDVFVDIDTAYNNLANAIVEQAITDLRRAYNGKVYQRTKAEDAIADCEDFFKSKHFALRVGHTSDESILAAIKQQAEYDKWKETANCKKCSNCLCIHFEKDNWTRTPYECIGFEPKTKKKIKDKE